MGIMCLMIDKTKWWCMAIYNRGHAAEGVWCVGGIKCSDEKKYLYAAVGNRPAETIKHI